MLVVPSIDCNELSAGCQLIANSFLTGVVVHYFLLLFEDFVDFQEIHDFDSVLRALLAYIFLRAILSIFLKSEFDRK